MNILSLWSFAWSLPLLGFVGFDAIWRGGRQHHGMGRSVGDYRHAGWNVTEGHVEQSPRSSAWWPCPSSVSKFRRLSGGSGEIGLRATENRGDKATSATAGDTDWREALEASVPQDSLHLWNAGLADYCAYRRSRRCGQ